MINLLSVKAYKKSKKINQSAPMYRLVKLYRESIARLAKKKGKGS